MAQREANKALNDFTEALVTTKRNIREGIANNHPDKEAMIEYAKFLIDAEKQTGLYDPDDWAWLTQK